MHLLLNLLAAFLFEAGLFLDLSKLVPLFLGFPLSVLFGLQGLKLASFLIPLGPDFFELLFERSELCLELYECVLFTFFLSLYVFSAVLASSLFVLDRFLPHSIWQQVGQLIDQCLSTSGEALLGILRCFFKTSFYVLLKLIQCADV